MASNPAQPARDLSSLRIDPADLRGGVRRRRVWLPILLLLVATAALLGFIASRARGPALGSMTVPPPARPASDVLLTATGYVVAQRKAAVGAKIPGILETITVEEGTPVRKGQVIARLEASDLRAAAASAEAEIAAARADLAQARAEQVEKRRVVRRLTALVDEGVVDRAGLEAAQAGEEAGEARIGALTERLRAAEARAAQAQAILRQAQVVAPFDGVVLTKDADIGESVAPAVGGGGTTRGSMVTMADMDSLEVEADVSESQIARLSVGTPSEIVLDAFPDKPFPAVLHQVVPTADRQKATVQVKVRFTGDRTGALPEMSAKVNFLSPEALTRPGPRSVITIPATALRGDGLQRTVLLVDAGTTREASVTLARAPQSGQAEVTGGLSGGEEILTAPPADLAAGTSVRTLPAAS